MDNYHDHMAIIMHYNAFDNGFHCEGDHRRKYCHENTIFMIVYDYVCNHRIHHQVINIDKIE